MADKAVNAFTTQQVFPKYVTDETLKRARVEDANGNSAIRVSSNEVVPDLSEIKSRIGAKDEPKWDDSVDTNPGSVISILKSIDGKVNKLDAWQHLADGPGTVSLNNSTTFNILNMVGGVKPAGIDYLVLLLRLHGTYSAIWLPANAQTNMHFVLKQEELGKYTNSPNERAYSGIQFSFDVNTWVLSVQMGYYTYTKWDPDTGNITITSNSNDLSQMVFTFASVEGVFMNQ